MLITNAKAPLVKGLRGISTKGTSEKRHRPLVPSKKKEQAPIAALHCTRLEAEDNASMLELLQSTGQRGPVDAQSSVIVKLLWQLREQVPAA